MNLYTKHVRINLEYDKINLLPNKTPTKDIRGCHKQSSSLEQTGSTKRCLGEDKARIQRTKEPRKVGAGNRSGATQQTSWSNLLEKSRIIG